jgi:inner membrane transporter RhtA
LISHNVTARHEQARLKGFEAELLFLVSAFALNGGNAIAKAQFDNVAPATMAWLRMFGAMVVACAIIGPKRLAPRHWPRASLKSAAIFGLSTGLTSTFFYLAINRLPLGKGVAIEFIGPIAVAAFLTRTRRNALALIVAVSGVLILSGVEFSDEPLGIVFILLAAAFWAIHIVYGGRVANAHGGLDGLAMSFVFGTLLTFPFAVPDIATAILNPYLIGLGIVVGALASVTSYGIDQRILRIVTVRHYSVLLAMLPVVATAFGYFVFSQTPEALDYVGGMLIIAGIVLQERR